MSLRPTKTIINEELMRMKADPNNKTKRSINVSFAEGDESSTDSECDHNRYFKSNLKQKRKCKHHKHIQDKL